MTRIASMIAAPTAALLAAACVTPTLEALHTRRAMIEGVNPAAVAIWDVTNAAIGDDGGLDPRFIDAEGWDKLEDGARMLEVYGRRMAEAKVIVAGGPDLVSGELPPGVASKEQIQAMIDADPDGFRAVSAQMAQQAVLLAAAADRRDATAAGELAADIDVACQSCHTRYWYLQAE